MMNRLNEQPQELAMLSNPEVRCLTDAIVVDRMVVRDQTVVDYYTSMSDKRRALSAHEAGPVPWISLA